MAFQKKSGFTRRMVDHVTDEVVKAMSGGASYEFKELFKVVYAGLKLKNAVSGGEEMLRLRCYEKLQNLSGRGLVERKLKVYRGLAGIEKASSAHAIAMADAAMAARVAAAS